MPDPTNRDIMSALDSLRKQSERTDIRLERIDANIASLTHKADQMDMRVKMMESDIADMQRVLNYLLNSHISHVTDGGKHIEHDDS